MLDTLEYRWDWASFGFTVDLFKYVFLNFIPDIIFHTQAQDQEQIRDNYDRTCRAPSVELDAYMLIILLELRRE